MHCDVRISKKRYDGCNNFLKNSVSKTIFKIIVKNKKVKVFDRPASSSK